MVNKVDGFGHLLGLESTAVDSPWRPKFGMLPTVTGLDWSMNGFAI